MFKLENIDLSLRPSPLDERDWKASSIYPGNDVLPETFDMRKDLKAIRNQGRQGSCTTFAAGCMKEYQEFKDDALWDYMACQFLYNQRANNSPGMHLRDAMSLLKSKGICTESKFPYGEVTTRGASTIPQAAFTEALNHRIISYARVETLENLKQALCRNGPCMIAFPVYNGGMQFWMQEKPDQKMGGGHCIAVVGYTKDAFIMRNSWGMWGDKGYCYYPFSQWGAHWEIWTSIDDNSNKIDGLRYGKPDPAPVPPKPKCCTIM